MLSNKSHKVCQWVLCEVRCLPPCSCQRHSKERRLLCHTKETQSQKYPVPTDRSLCLKQCPGTEWGSGFVIDHKWKVTTMAISLRFFLFFLYFALNWMVLIPTDHLGIRKAGHGLKCMVVTEARQLSTRQSQVSVSSAALHRQGDVIHFLEWPSHPFLHLLNASWNTHKTNHVGQKGPD